MYFYFMQWSKDCEANLEALQRNINHTLVMYIYTSRTILLVFLHLFIVSRSVNKNIVSYWSSMWLLM